MVDTTRPGFNEVGNAETGDYVSSVGTMDDDGPGGTEGKVNILAREKQTDADGEIYYAMNPSENKTLTILGKTNKTPIFISS